MSPLTDARPRLRLWIMIALAFLTLVAVVLSLAAIFGTFNKTSEVQSTTNEVRDTQLEGTPFGKKLAKSVDDIASVLAILQDCLDPNGVCGQQAAENQRSIARRLHDDTITIAVCADKPGTQTRAEIEACVEESRS